MGVYLCERDPFPVLEILSIFRALLRNTQCVALVAKAAEVFKDPLRTERKKFNFFNKPQVRK